MSYSITFKESVWRDLNKIDKHQVKIILAKIEDLLPEGAESYPAFTGQFSKLRKLRVRNYRVIYTIKEDTVLDYTHPTQERCISLMKRM